MLQGPFVSPLTCGVCELEGDGFVRDTADIADRHLACVAGIILRPKVLQLQDFGFTLGFGKNRGEKRHRCTKQRSSFQVHILSQSLQTTSSSHENFRELCRFQVLPALYKGDTKCLQWSFHLQGFSKHPATD